MKHKMMVNVKTRSGRVASQYRFKSSIDDQQKKQVNLGKAQVNTVDEKVVSKNDSNPNKIKAQKIVQRNLGLADQTSKMNTRQRTKICENTTLIDKNDRKRRGCRRELIRKDDKNQASNGNTDFSDSSKLRERNKDTNKGNDTGYTSKMKARNLNKSPTNTCAKQQTRKKSNIIDLRPVFVICEKTVSGKTNTPENSFLMPSCVITYNSTVEKAIQDTRNESVNKRDQITSRNNKENSNIKKIFKNDKADEIQQAKQIDKITTEERIGRVNDINMVNRNNLKNNLMNNNLNLNKNQVNENDVRNQNTTNSKPKKNQRNILNTSDSKNKNDNFDTTVQKRLRFRKQCDYKEITLSNSQDSLNTTETEKVKNEPIYKKKIISPKKQVRGKKDVYEFKEDLEMSVSDGEFESGTASFIKELEQRFNKKNKRDLTRKDVSKKRTLQNINRVNKVERDLRNKKNNCKRDKKPVENMAKESKHVVAIKNRDNINDENKKDSNPLIKNKEISDNEIELFERSGSVNTNNTSSHQGSSKSLQLFNSPVHISSPAESNKSSPTRVLSNILIRSSNALNDTIPLNDSIHFNFKKPNANSTMFIQRSPWRPTIALKSNPLFLATKKSSLPNYDQDMVINSKMLNKSCSTPIKIHDNTKNQVKSPLKRTKQASITDYINSSIPTDSIPDENRFNYSLYDADQLSPVKKRQSRKHNILKDCTNNFSSKKNLSVFNVEDGNKFPPINKLSPIKHVPLVDNQKDVYASQNVTSNNCNKSLPSPPKTVSSIDDTFSYLDVDNSSVYKEGKPTRLSVNEVKKFMFRNVKNKKKLIAPEKPMTKPKVDEVGNITDNNEIDVQNNAPIVGLFEDFEAEKVPPKATYGRLKSRTKRVRYISENEDCTDDTVEHPKKKRKDLRTKEEELEAERWAAKFNEMIKEVDKYQLTIE